MVVPATDDELRTHVVTPAGRFSFQDWFVRRRHADEVDAIELTGAAAASPAPGTVEAIAAADAIVFAPSNPYVSLEPILAVTALANALRGRSAPLVAVSPLVGGTAVKGPLDRMLNRMAGEISHAAVVARYPGLVDVLVVDADDGRDPGVPIVVTDTLMPDREAAKRLAQTTLEAIG